VFGLNKDGTNVDLCAACHRAKCRTNFSIDNYTPLQMAQLHYIQTLDIASCKDDGEAVWNGEHICDHQVILAKGIRQ